MPLAQDAKQKVLSIQYLPPLSATATHLLRLLSDENLALHDLTEVINQDPGLSAKVLGLANSAYFGQSTPIISVEEAIIRVLGLNMVKSLSFSIAVCGAFDTAHCPGFDLSQYWFNALSLGALSRAISLAVDSDQRPDLNAVYLAGLLKDIGVLVLVHVFPEAFSEVLSKLSKESAQQETERLQSEKIGLNQRDAGMLLMDRWHLPELIVKVVAQEEQIDPVILDESETPMEAVVVGLVSRWLRREWSDDADERSAIMTLSKQCGLSLDKINTIKKRFLLKEQEIRGIASVLSHTHA
jgi:HD-like signal output (HDOD) protein